MAIIRFIGKSGNEVEVNSNNQLEVNTPSDPLQAGYVTPVGEAYEENAEQSIPRLTRPIDVSQDYRLRIALDHILFQDKFSYTVFDYSRYLLTVSTMTVAFASNKLVLNSASALALNNLAQVRTKKHFPLFATFPVYAEAWLDFQGLPVLNTRFEIGAAIWPGTNAAITDGIVLRFENNTAKAVVSFNGSELEYNITPSFVSGVLGVLAINTTYHLLIVSTNDEVVFYINEFPVAKFDRPSGSSALFSSASLQLGARVLNTGVAATACIARISEWNVQGGDVGNPLPLPEAMVSMGHNIYRNPPGSVSGFTTRFTNSAAPTAITAMANNALPTGPTHTNMIGGDLLINALVGAETDLLVYGFQVPAASATQPGKSLVITGIKIDMWSLGAAVGANGNVYQWFVDINSTAIALNTTDLSSGALGGERLHLGTQIWKPSDPVLTKGETITLMFPEGLVIHPGLWWKVGLKIPVGLATASLQFRGTVTPIGYFL